jgi:ABC-type nitrate/sulfonate/bicarbonate transport system substrate-binding protein
MIRRVLVLATVLVVIAVVTAACGSSSPSATSSSASSVAATTTQVRFVYDWITPDAELLPVLVARDLGYYKAAGIETSIAFPPDNSTTMKVLATGKADIGFDTTVDVVFAKAQDMPILAIANYGQTNNWGLIGRPGEPINISQLKGKSIGVFTDAWTKAMMPFILKAANLKATDVKQIICQSSDIPLLLDKKLDLATNTANYGIPDVTTVVHKQPTVLLAKDIGAPDVPVWDYVASTSWLSSNGAVAKAWLAATQKGTEWAIANPVQAAAMFNKDYGKQSGSSDAYNLANWQATMPILQGANGSMLQTDAQWTSLDNALVGVKLLDKALAPSAYYTNQYVTK